MSEAAAPENPPEVVLLVLPATSSMVVVISGFARSSAVSDFVNRATS